MSGDIRKDVIDFYDSIPPEKRRYMQWVLSTATVKKIAEDAGVDIGDADMQLWSLMGKLIEIDENIQGLSYKVWP